VDPYFLLLAVVGAAIVAAAVLRRALTRVALSPPILYLATGMAIFALPLGLDGPQPGADEGPAERLTELVVIVSLMGAGLKLNRPPGWLSWMPTWRLLGITMPVTIGATTLVAAGPLGLAASSALLLGAVVAPTDPVLASDVQVEGPSEEDADDEVRFALTSEAGLNDAFAFPFTHLALAVAGGGAWFARWAVEYVVIRITVGLLMGFLLGRLIAWLMFRGRAHQGLANTSEGFVAVGATLAVYGATEIAHGYGFLGVFVAAVTIRDRERDHEYHQVLHSFSDTTEHLASIVFLLLLGGAVVDGGLRALTPGGAALAVGLVLVIRPVAGLLGLLGTGIDRDERAAIAFFGIRGMGSIYYLSYAASEDYFPDARQVWAVAILVIVASIVIHGTTSTVVLRALDRRKRRDTALTA
jgi:NhaP-type Na+/H+ or K+/H+ antiporter